MAPSATSTVLPSELPVSKVAGLKIETPHSQPSQKTPLQALSHGSATLTGPPKFQDFALQRRWQLEHMAAAFRHWAREGYVEGFSGHISVRDPEYHDAFWTNPLGVHFGLLTVSDMILVNFGGEVIGGNRSMAANSAGFLIHSEVHKARPDVHAVCHAHSTYGKAWSVFGKPLEMLTQDACKFYGKAQAVYNNHGGVVLGKEEGEKIAQALGQGKGAILRNHGLLTVGATVDEAAFLFTSMEHSCKVQLLAEAATASGLEKVLIADQEAQFNYDAESDPEVCYAEFQVYYNFEDKMSKGEMKQ
ncbi:related to novobiocin biosynthesis protein novR [Phialocephala subalpina]|uniref:Related to novobiocin biosynthesis protein novR n=1 Tax=Phialocephala subalpina TaxID=576137 RepID=A0A1L7X5G4_9HELO|nr:related to novobiocin biosynthesis protein novR [Phialocephala subalpina]